MKEQDKNLHAQIDEEQTIHNSEVCRKIISTPSSNKVYPTPQITTLSDEQNEDLDPLESSGGLNNIEIDM